ncbi:hypothetical protein ACIBO6_24220 [Streptomyces luteogriseus]|uniref:hypothetical protein n=1 Tax=Streptomyces luteogriseus TaxID=68233 RepID=UPI0037956909
MAAATGGDFDDTAEAVMNGVMNGVGHATEAADKYNEAIIKAGISAAGRSVGGHSTPSS